MFRIAVVDTETSDLEEDPRWTQVAKVGAYRFIKEIGAYHSFAV
jgi:hypothetical protein